MLHLEKAEADASNRQRIQQTASVHLVLVRRARKQSELLHIKTAAPRATSEKHDTALCTYMLLTLRPWNHTQKCCRQNKQSWTR